MNCLPLPRRTAGRGLMSFFPSAFTESRNTTPRARIAALGQRPHLMIASAKLRHTAPAAPLITLHAFALRDHVHLRYENGQKGTPPKPLANPSLSRPMDNSRVPGYLTSSR